MATKLKFNANEFRKELMAGKREWEKEQTRRLAVYAAEEITKIGDKIGMKDTGNLLDSLCWGLWFNGNLVKNGYYRSTPEATYDSYLHALSPMPPKESVNGRYLAQTFLAQYQPIEEHGWELVWGALAPYYAYWESGHNNKLLKQYVRFTAMAERYDHIEAKMLPQARVRFICTVTGY